MVLVADFRSAAFTLEAEALRLASLSEASKTSERMKRLKKKKLHHLKPFNQSLIILNS